MDACLLICEHRARATEASRNFVGNQKQIVLSTYAFDPLECLSRMKTHTRGHLNQRLDDHRRELLLLLPDK